MRQWIASHYRFLDEQASTSFEQRMLQRQNAMEEEERQQELKMSKYIDDYRRDKCFYMDRISLGAGRIRQQKADEIGIKEWVGN